MVFENQQGPISNDTGLSSTAYSVTRRVGSSRILITNKLNKPQLSLKLNTINFDINILQRKKIHISIPRIENGQVAMQKSSENCKRFSSYTGYMTGVTDQVF